MISLLVSTPSHPQSSSLEREDRGGSPVSAPTKRFHKISTLSLTNSRIPSPFRRLADGPGRVLFLTFFLTLSLSLQAQLGAPQTGGARGLGTGGVGLTYQDVHAAWSNPAGLGSLTATSFALFGEQRFLGSEVRQVSAAGALPVGDGAVGLAVGYYGFESYNEQRIGLLYGRKLSEKVQLGAQLYTLGVRIPEYGSRQVVSFELGLQAEVSPAVTLAGRVANPMRVEVIEGEELPAVLSAGLRYRPGSQVLLFGEVEKDILFPVRVRMGIEYELLETLYLRTGVATQPTQLSFGLGYALLDQWRFDFAANYHQYLGFTPGIGVVYTGRDRQDNRE